MKFGGVYAIKEIMKTRAPGAVVKPLRRAWSKVLKNAPIKMRQNYRRTKWNNHFHHQKFPVTVVAIETIGECNRECAYCPVSLVDKRRGRMATEVFESIVLQLKELNYQDEIFFHFYNEPLLDKRMIDHLKFTRQHLPENFLKLVTNGDPLTLKKANAILDAGVNVLGISMHDPETEEKAIGIIAGLQEEKRARVETYRFYDWQNHEYTNRAGTIVSDDFKVRRAASREGCDKTEFVIDYMGDVHPCSEDIGKGYVLGNVSESPLLDIWKNGRDRYRDHFTGNFCAVCRQCVGIDEAPILSKS